MVRATEFPYTAYDLDGVFTNAGGSIIGAPFSIGDSRTVIVPSGATQLQLGMDDNNYDDNHGAVTMNVSEASVPEPGTLALFAACALVAFAAWRWRRN